MEDALRRQAGVEEVHVAVQTNIATIDPDPERYVELAAIPRAVRQAGFTPGRMTIRAAGRFEEVNERLEFRIENWPQTYPVHDGAQWSAGSAKRIVATVDYGEDPLTLHARAADEE